MIPDTSQTPERHSAVAEELSAEDFQRANGALEALSSELVHVVRGLIAKAADGDVYGLAALRRITTAMELTQSHARHMAAVLQPADLSNARILALSTAQSQAEGGGYITYAENLIAEVLPESVRTITFIPYALRDKDAYAEKVTTAFSQLGLSVVSLHNFNDPVAAIENAEAVFVGGGNTFRLLQELHRTGVFPALRHRVEQGLPYIGASAGSNITMKSAGTTNDMPITDVLPPDLSGLHLFPFNLNPHYVAKTEAAGHLGESRDLRIQQFHEEQPQLPVLGLPEGAGILCVEGSVQIVGATEKATILFEAGKAPQALPSSADLSRFVMHVQ